MQECDFLGQHHHANERHLEQQVLEQTLRQATSFRGRQGFQKDTLGSCVCI